MNARWIIPALLALAGATACSQREGRVSEAQRIEITHQVMQTAMAMKAATERMDPDLFSKFCLDSPDFLYVSPYGDAFNFKQSQKLWSGLVYSFTSQTDTLQKTRVIVLSRDTALFYWVGHVHAQAKDGSVVDIAPYSGTDVFRQIGKTWKVVYIQESGLPAKVTHPTSHASGHS